MDEENWSVDERNLSDVTDFEAYDKPSDRKRKIHEKKQKGYTSLFINEEMMRTLNKTNGVRETLHNLVIHSSSSNFVFQKETKKKQSGSQKVIQNSATR
jgi:hypothetical protein